MLAGFRKFGGVCAWTLLACTDIFDARLGENAISGGDLMEINKDGYHKSPERDLWLPIGGLVLVQGALILALIRLRPHPVRESFIPRGDTHA